MEKNNNDILNSIVRIGTVSSVDAGRRTARVKFPDMGGMVSGDLKVLQHNGAAVNVQVSDKHSHAASVGYWMPRVNDAVVCLYLPVFNGDGFILGGVS